MSLLAIHLARRSLMPRRPGGYPSATNYAALLNAGWLLIFNIGVIITAILRLVGGVGEVHGLPVLIVSAIAAVVMAFRHPCHRRHQPITSTSLPRA